MLAVLAFGFICGFVGAVPVAGPVAAMVVQRAVDGRYWPAFWLAVGSGIADGLYALLAVVGFSLLDGYPWVDPASKALAGVILIGLGISFAIRKYVPEEEQPVGAKRGAASTVGQMIVGFGLTIVNPTLLATWAVATTTLVATGWVQLEAEHGLAFGTAVIIGVASWFGCLVLIIRKVRGRFEPATLHRFINWMGYAIVGVGAYFTWLFVRHLMDGPPPAG